MEVIKYDSVIKTALYHGLCRAAKLLCTRQKT